MTTPRVHWASRIGFILAVAGSAVGLANIWRFPYLVGKNGGAAFVAVYLLSLFVIGFPVFMAEILIGRTTQVSPSSAFRRLGKNTWWSGAGKLTIATGFLVSAFYSAIAGWILGYLFEALRGNLGCITNCADAVTYYTELIHNPWWGVGFHLLFLVICTGILYFGVRKGIERGTKIMMPMLFLVLGLLVIKGLTLPNASQALSFLFDPDWSELTPIAVLIAMGQAFFTLSLGQGTMVTYGSYLDEDENLIKSCFPIVIVDTLVSIFAAIAVFTIVFSAGMQPDSGPGLIFHTLPTVFSQMPGGYLLAILFFLLVALAAVTSEISAMEPTIAYLMDDWGWNRKPAVYVTGIGAFLVGIPCALSSSVLSAYTFKGLNILELFDVVASGFLIPIGGFLAIILVGWRWGTANALRYLKRGSSEFFKQYPVVETYFSFCFKYAAPTLIVVVFLNALGVFG